MEGKFARREKLFWELIGRFLTFILGITLMVLPEKFPTNSFFKTLFYESLGIAVCFLAVAFTIARVLRAYNWIEAKKTNPLQYVGFKSTNKSGR